MFYWIIVTAAWLVWHIGFRIRVIGRENLPRDRGFILAPNHISAIDPVFVVIARYWGRRMLILAKEEIMELNPVFSWMFRHVGVVGIERGKGDTGAVEKAVAYCREGGGLLIFPEGTRSKTAQPGPVKSGAFIVASQAAVDLIPCRIIYDTPDGRMRVFCRTRVCFGPAIPAGQLAIPEEGRGRALRHSKQMLTDAWEKLYEENHF